MPPHQIPPPPNTHAASHQGQHSKFFRSSLAHQHKQPFSSREQDPPLTRAGMEAGRLSTCRRHEDGSPHKGETTAKDASGRVCLGWMPSNSPPGCVHPVLPQLCIRKAHMDSDSATELPLKGFISLKLKIGDAHISCRVVLKS